MNKLVRYGLAVALLILTASLARATFTININQGGGSVSLTGSGSLDLTALTLVSTATHGPEVTPSSATLLVGFPAQFNTYSGASAPANFGSGGETDTNIGNGSLIGANGAGQIFVNSGYSSGSFTTDSATFINASYASLGITPGTYAYTWGSGAHADSLVVNIVPEPSTWALLGVGTVGAGVLVLLRRRQAAV